MSLDKLDPRKDVLPSNVIASILGTDKINRPNFCHKCQTSDFTTYKLQQTRSADEKETLKVHCTKCGKRWNC